MEPTEPMLTTALYHIYQILLYKSLLKKTGEIRNLMNLHNNEAGRRVGYIYFIMFTNNKYLPRQLPA